MKNFQIYAAIMAFFFYGGYAFVVNKMMSSAILQGISSAIVTIILGRLVCYFYENIEVSGFGRILLPPVITVSITGAYLYTAHTFIGTHYVLTTISLPISISFVYCCLLVRKMVLYKAEAE